MRRRADIVFTRAKLAVYVDGCFWHGCPLHRTTPKANRDWWADKLAANETRDRATDRQLRDFGWNVLRFWEHQTPAEVADMVAAAVSMARSGPKT